MSRNNDERIQWFCTGAPQRTIVVRRADAELRTAMHAHTQQTHSFHAYLWAEYIFARLLISGPEFIPYNARATFSISFVYVPRIRSQWLNECVRVCMCRYALHQTNLWGWVRAEEWTAEEETFVRILYIAYSWFSLCSHTRARTLRRSWIWVDLVGWGAGVKYKTNMHTHTHT